MALKNIIITGSIGAYPTLSYGQKEYISSTDEQSFPIEELIGSNGGSFPNLLGQTSSLDLYVNIDQKWSGYNDTPSGLVAYTHSIQDEFINGEFSGSAYVVTNGELSDEECQKFLEVNTTTVTYNPFFYSELFNDLNSFLYSGTSPNNGELYLYVDIIDIFTNKAKVVYIKINRYDDEGNDNTLSLQELTTLRLQTSIGILNLNLLSVTEYPSYYLYTTDTPISISTYTISPDSNILNYYTSASNNSIQTGSISYYPSPLKYNNVAGDILGYLNSSTGIYTFNDTPNVPIYIEATASLSSVIGTLGTEIRLYKINPNGGLYGVAGILATSTNITSGGTSSLYLSGSFSPLKGESYVISISDDTPVDTDITASFINLLIEQVFPPSSSTNLTVLEPYLTENFYYSDCNALFGNQDGLEYNNDFMKVDYDNGYVIPSNQQQILSNTAERAPVKPYNYALKSQTLPRYEGVRVTQQNPFLNRDPQTNALFFTGNYTWTPGDIAPDKTPSVKISTSYLAYFNSLKSNNPIFKDTTSPVIKYLIREDGTTFNPATDDITYYNSVFSFPPYSKAYTNLLYNTTTTFNSTQSILLSGESYTPILYNLKEYYGDNANWTGSLNFTNIVGGYVSNPTNFDFNKISNAGPTAHLKQLFLFNNWNPNNYFYNIRSAWSSSGTYVISTDNSIPSAGTKINSNSSEINPYYWGTGSSALWPYNPSDDGYGPNSGTWVQDIDTTPNPDPITGSYYKFTSIPQSSVNIEFAPYVVRGAQPFYNTTTNWATNYINLRLRIYLKRGSSVTQLGYKDYTNVTANESTPNITISGFFPLLNDEIFPTVENTSNNQAFAINVYNPAGGNGCARFKISTNQDIGTVNDVPYFWTTGSDNSNVITSSIQLGAALQGNFKQVDITSSGFDPIQLPASIQIGDEFRFEYDENNTFKVISSSLYSSGSGIACSVIFDRSIPTSPNLDINHFTVRRKVKDYITGISLGNNLSIPISGGFLLPENPSDAIVNNLPKIISDLSEKNKI